MSPRVRPGVFFYNQFINLRDEKSIIKFYQGKFPGQARNDSTIVDKRLRYRISKMNTVYDPTND